MVLEVDLRVANDGGAVIPGDRVYFSVAHRNVPVPSAPQQQQHTAEDVVLEWSAVQIVGQALCSTMWVQPNTTPPNNISGLFTIVYC